MEQFHSSHSNQNWNVPWNKIFRILGYNDKQKIRLRLAAQHSSKTFSTNTYSHSTIFEQKKAGGPDGSCGLCQLLSTSVNCCLFYSPVSRNPSSNLETSSTVFPISGFFFEGVDC